MLPLAKPLLVGGRFVCPGCWTRGASPECSCGGGPALDLSLESGREELTRRWPGGRPWQRGASYWSPRWALSTPFLWRTWLILGVVNGVAAIIAEVVTDPTARDVPWGPAALPAWILLGLLASVAFSLALYWPVLVAFALIARVAAALVRAGIGLAQRWSRGGEHRGNLGIWELTTLWKIEGPIWRFFERTLAPQLRARIVEPGPEEEAGELGERATITVLRDAASWVELHDAVVPALKARLGDGRLTDLAGARGLLLSPALLRVGRRDGEAALPWVGGRRTRAVSLEVPVGTRFTLSGALLRLE